MSVNSRKKDRAKAVVKSEIKTSNRYDYSKGDVKLGFSLLGIREHEDFVPLLKQAIVDVEAKLAEIINAKN